MYFARRPSARDIELFLRRSQDLPLSYGPVGVVREPPPQRSFDEQTVLLGRSPRVFERACTALADWRHFEIGWVEKYPRQPSIAVGTVVAVLIRHLGFWSLNGCRVVYHVGDDEPLRCGYAYGTLPNHAEGGRSCSRYSWTRVLETCCIESARSRGLNRVSPGLANPSCGHCRRAFDAIPLQQ